MAETQGLEITDTALTIDGLEHRMTDMLQALRHKENQISARETATAAREAACDLRDSSQQIESKRVMLDVGGVRYSTSRDTLSGEESMLSAMFCGRFDVTTEADGGCRYCSNPHRG